MDYRKYFQNLDPAQAAGMRENHKQSLLNRRRFLGTLGVAGAAVATAPFIAACGSDALASGPTSNDVFNFALNLEYLEATFYSYLTQGTDLPSNLISGSGSVTNPPAQPAWQSQLVEDLVNEVYYDEMSHVADIQALLGSAAVPRPALNLGALGAVTTDNYLSLSRTFEDVGVTAYAGAAQLLSGQDLTYAAQILAVEGFHAGALRYAVLLYGESDTLKVDPVDVLPYDPGTGTLASQGPASNGGFFATAGASNSGSNTSSGFSTTFPGLAFARTTSQVLQIVYGAVGQTGVSSGGFFPNGVNGNIRST